MLLIVTATARESEAVLAGLGGIELARPLAIGPYDAAGIGSVVTLVCGIGPAAAAAATATALALAPYDVAVSTGIAGGFATAGVSVGELVVADPIVSADVGVLAAEGWLSFGTDPASGDGSVLAAALGLRHGPLLTLATMTGSHERARELGARHPGVIAEAMEGAGVAEAASHFGVPVYELRALSNLVGPRDRDSWDIDGALAALTAIAAALVTALEPI